MKQILSFALLLFTCMLARGQAQYLHTTIQSTNAVVYLPDGYTPGTAHPLIYFRHGDGEKGTDINKMYVHGPFKKVSGNFLYDQTWTFTVNGQTLKPIIIAHQVPFSYNYGSNESSKPNFHNSSLNEIISRWSIDTNKICMTGYSAGGWGIMGYVSYSQTYANRVHAIAVVAAQAPGATSPSTSSYTHRSSNIINAGTRWFGSFGSNDAFNYDVYGQAVYDTLNNAGATAEFRLVSGAGHYGQYVEDFFNPQFTDPVLGTDIYTWMLSDTATNIPPVSNAGTDQSITLPTSSVTVNGGGSSDADGSITTYLWTKISGPSGGTITSASSASTSITGLTAGTYVFRLTVTDDDGATHADDITITVNAAAGSKTINVTIDNVANYFKDPAWNSWHVTGNVLSGVTSGTFNYSDGTASTVTAFMNRQIATNDNTTSYTGFTGLPDSALRYVSSHSNNRVLTIDGVDNTKTYDITLYSSRNSAGFSTVFEYGGTPVAIATSSNKTAVAQFTNITPMGGAFTINISNASGSTYNHLNAFVITEITSSPFRMVKNTRNTSSPDKKAVTVRITPNPVQSVLQVNVSLNSVRLTITDLTGRMVKNIQLQPGTHSIDLQKLAAGHYQVAIHQKGKWIETQEFIKL